jgi:hypothetical protein
MTRFAVLVAVPLLVGVSSVANAKSQAVMSGVVTDVMGAVVPGTRITFTNERTRENLAVTTSDIGRYEVKLRPGVYSISTEKRGFNPYRQTGIRLRRREQRVMNIQMTTGIDDFETTLPVETRTAPIPWSLTADAKPLAVVSGVVTDVNGAVVPGTRITFTNERTKKRTVEMTSEVGRYEAKLLPGVYSVSTEKYGFHRFRRSGIRLREGQERVVDIQLKCCIEDIVVVPDDPSGKRLDRSN